MEFKQYPSYKNSGVEWLGDVPEGWHVIPSKFYFIERKEKAENTDKQLTASQKLGIIFQEDFMAENGRVMVVMKNPEILKKVRPNDFVISMRSFQGGLELSYLEGSISSAYVMLKPNLNVVDIEYFKYLFKTTRYIQSLQSTSNLIRDGQALRFNNFSQVKLVLPSKSDQQKIVFFLDTETARIDNLISKQQKLIELLEEQRKSIISYAVTKGLNPNAPMKDSGVEWLGEVPDGWAMLKLNFVVNQIADIDHYMPNSSSQGFPYLMTGDLQEKVSLIDFLKCKQVSTEDYLHLSKKIKSSKGDLILARYATIGTVSYVDIDANFLVSYSCVTIKPKLSKIIGMYLYYYIKSNAFYNFCKNYINTNTQGNLGIDNLKKINVLLPSIFEQENIINFLDSENLKFDNLISKQKNLIEKLKEYRSSIISHAVTGKIDVREWVV